MTPKKQNSWQEEFRRAVRKNWKKSGLYQKDYAKKIGFSQQAFSRWMNGKTARLLPEHQHKAEKLLGVTLEITERN